MTMTLRAALSRPLTHAEMDANWGTALDRANHTGSEATATIYVAKIGSDANAGTHPDRPKATLASAVAAASALIAGGATGVRLEVLDGGEYTYTADTIFVIPANVHVVAPAATFIGRVAVTALSSFQIDKHYPETTGGWTVRHNGGNGPAFYKSNILDNRGKGGAFTGGYCVRNNGDAGKNLLVEVGVMYVSANCVGVGDTSGDTPGHIHLKVGDIYLAGNSAVGINGIASGTNIIGYVDHILEIGTPTNTVGVNVTTAGAVVRLVTAQVIADTAFNVSNGRLSLNCLDVTGVETHTGGTVVRPTLLTVTI